jgi:glycerol-3-phosphate cytidylyltransferase-like family protein
MTLDERVAVIQACRYVDEAVPNAPFVVTTEFLDAHGAHVMVHGDDLPPHGIEKVFGAVAAAGRLKLVSYTPGISTTDLIRRVRERPE